MPSKQGDDKRLHISDECRRAKAEFPTRPGDALVREIKQFIAGNPYPHLWWGHTHSKPSVGSKPVYLDEFDLPASIIKSGRLAPCPCCTPFHPKYGLSGKIAWFPDEGVIRLIGPDCFAAMDKNAHNDAVDQLRREKRRKHEIAYLFQNKDALRALPAVFEAARQVGNAIDQLRAELRRTFNDRLAIPIWESVRTGKLRVWESFKDLDRRGEVQTLTRLRDYAPVRGIQLLSPETKGYAFRASQFIVGLVFLEEEGWSERIAEMPDMQRRQTATLISTTIRKARKLFADINEIQEFVHAANVATLRTWAARADCPQPFLFERKGSFLLIGTRPNAMLRVPIPAHFEDELGRIDVPVLSEMRDEDEAFQQAA